VLAVLVAGGCALTTAPDGQNIAHLDEAAVRAFAADEQAAWNAHDFDRYYARCAPEAVFVSVRWNPDGTITHETRTREQDRASAERFFKEHPGHFSESDAIDRIVIAPDGQSARIIGHETARIEGVRDVMRATTEQKLAIRSGHVLLLSQTDTQVR